MEIKYETDLMYLIHKIYKKRHFDCSKYKISNLKRRIEKRLYAAETRNGLTKDMFINVVC